MSTGGRNTALGATDSRNFGTEDSGKLTRILRKRFRFLFGGDDSGHTRRRSADLAGSPRRRRRPSHALDRRLGAHQYRRLAALGGRIGRNSPWAGAGIEARKGSGE